MSQLQSLLDEKYPDNTEISHIQRAAFTAGYQMGYEKAENDMLEDGYQKPIDFLTALRGE